MARISLQLDADDIIIIRARVCVHSHLIFNIMAFSMPDNVNTFISTVICLLFFSNLFLLDLIFRPLGVEMTFSPVRNDHSTSVE